LSRKGTAPIVGFDKVGTTSQQAESVCVFWALKIEPLCHCEGILTTVF